MTLQAPAFFYHFTPRQLIWWGEPQQFAVGEGDEMVVTLVNLIEITKTGFDHRPSLN